MIENSEICLSQKTSRSPYKNNVLKEMGKKNLWRQYPSEQKARDQVAKGLRRIRGNPTSNSIFIEQRKKQLETEKAKQDLERISIIDPLTKVYHRRFLEGDLNASPPQKGILEREIERILRDNKGDKKLTVAMFDIDSFKAVNDQYGHQVGDEVLRKVAETVLKNIRFGLGDFAIRYGGDEFLIITPNDLDIAQKMIEKIREAIEKIRFDSEKYPESITISCGMTNLTTEKGDPKEIAHAMIKRADAALYKSKFEGRNQTTVVVRGTDRVKYEKITPEEV